MANSYTLYKGTPGQQSFAVPFPYLLQSDVQVYLNGVQQAINVNYVWLNAGTIQLNGSLIANTDVLIQRSTSPNSADVTFTPGAVLTAAQLNTANLQNFYRTQEIQDELDQYINGGLSYYQINGGGDLSAQELINAVTQSILSSALLQQLNQSLTDIDTNGQDILSLTNNVNTLQTTVDALANLGGELGGLATWIQTEQTQRIAGDSALAQELSLIGAVSGDNLSFILNQSTVMVDSTTSLADFITGIDSQFGSVNGQVAAVQASITSEATTRASADNALATSVSNLSSTVTSNQSSLQSLISTLQSTLTTNYSTTSTMQTYVGSQITGATTNLTAAIAANYVTTASLNGIVGATYTLQTQVTSGGVRYVSGFGIMNNGASGSEFIIEANTFALVDPGNGVTAPTVPFAVQNGTVFMENVVIHDALIDSLQISKLTQGALNADMEIGTGHVVFNSGTFLRVLGTGFGNQNQFVDWFGPLVAGTNWNNSTGQPIYSGFTPTNAIYYLTNAGNALFAGEITTGLITGGIDGLNNILAVKTKGDQITIQMKAAINAVYQGYTPTGGGTGTAPAAPSGSIQLQWSNDQSSWSAITPNLAVTGAVSADQLPASSDGNVSVPSLYYAPGNTSQLVTFTNPAGARTMYFRLVQVGTFNVGGFKPGTVVTTIDDNIGPQTLTTNGFAILSGSILTQE